VRNLRLIITFWLASFAMPGISFALGLGEIDVSSFLNQPLEAEIEVISARPGEIDDLLVSLASRDSFARAGLSRPNHLSDLRFAVKKNEGGDEATILVTTKNAIKEPFLNFLVEADWSKGRVLREFTVLLDPPFYADSSTPTPSSSASEQTIADPIIETEASVTDNSQSSGNVIATANEEISAPIARPSEVNTTESTATEASTRATSSTALGSSVIVEKGDALWSIASQFKDSEHSMGQVMLAMQRANPEAFSKNNINNLKIGAVFRAPTVDELDQLNKQEAYAQVLEQNGLWDDYVARVTGTSVSIASGDAGSDGVDSEQSVNGNFSLLTPGDSDSKSAGQGEGGDTSELKNQLALAEEQLDASRIENQEMQSRIADLEARLSKFDELQKMVEIEDDSLAQLQADQAVIVEETESSSPDSVVEEMLSAEEEALLDEILSKGTEASNNDEIVVAPPAPVIVTETQLKEPSIFDGILPPGVIDLIAPMSGLLDNPIALGGLGGVAILLLGLVLYRRRKSSEDEGDAVITVSDVELEEPFSIDDDLTPVNFAESATDADTNINVDLFVQENIDDEEDEFSRTAVISQADMPVPEAVDSAAPAEQDDVLNEVDVYLAYGLYDNAEELLKQSLDANPARADYRSKLLDTYFATKNVDDFSNEAELLKSMGSAGARYWDKVQIMGYELAPGNALFSAGKDSNISVADLEVAKPEMADFDLGASEQDTVFSATDFNLDEGGDDFVETPSVQTGADTDTQDFSDIDDLGDAPQLDDDLPDELGELEFTLDGEVEDISEINFDVSDDLDLDGGTNELENVSLDFDMDEAEDLSSESNTDLDNFESTAIINAPIDESITASQPEADFDLGMDDTALMGAQGANEDNEDIQFDLDESAQQAGLDSLDLGSDDPSVDSDLDLALDDSIDINEESLSFDMDLSSENQNARTGTFAPGDFDDPDETIIPDEIDINDIGDLMLPDDVDEVSTKLDLARAFIDMGDAEGARGSLDEVLAEGTDEQKAEAAQLLEKM
jgi:pilus assembly protein FimV